MEYKNWLSPISLHSASEDEVVLSVPNVFVQEYLLENFREELLLHFPVKNSGDLAISFVIKAPEKKRVALPKIFKRSITISKVQVTNL